MTNLSENSKSYYQQHDIYKIFSDAEDHPDFIFQSLEHEFYGKNVLDLGCGNGKYSQKIQPICSSLISGDKSLEQLSHFQEMPLQSNVLQLDAMQLPFKDNSFDVIFASWMLGTILDSHKQLTALREMKRVLKPQGKILLVENDFAADFEILRGRWPDKEKRTYHYNSWLLSQGFEVKYRLETYFQFESVEQAQYIFQSIWKERLIKLPQNAVINHNVIIFEYLKIDTDQE